MAGTSTSLQFRTPNLDLQIAYRYHQETDIKLAPLNRLKFSVWMSRGSALVLSVDVLLIMLTMCRNIVTAIRPRMRFLFDDMRWLHRQVAYALLMFTVIHVACHYVNFYNVERSQIRPERAVQILFTQPGSITGFVMCTCMALMYTTSHYRIRHQSFEAFWFTHHLYIPFLLALYTHGTGCFVRDTTNPISPFAGRRFWAHCIGYQSFRWEIAGGFLYLCERVYRVIRAGQSTSVSRVIKHPFGTFQIQFEKPSMRYRPGQWLFINVPTISPYEWHPFTITSCPYDPYISIHINQVGDWTKSLADAMGCGPAQESDNLDPLATYYIALRARQSLPQIRIDGPYGAAAEDVFANEVAVLVGTGIGITPWASVLKNLWQLHADARLPPRLKRVELIWVCRDTGAFEWFKSLLLSLEAQSAAAAAREPGAREFLRFRIYLTQKLDSDLLHNISLNSVEQGHASDPVTGLRAGTHFGRPNFRRILAKIRDDMIDEARPRRGRVPFRLRTIGCYYCGPDSLAYQVHTKQSGQEKGREDSSEQRFRQPKVNSNIT